MVYCWGSVCLDAELTANRCVEEAQGDCHSTLFRPNMRLTATTTYRTYNMCCRVRHVMVYMGDPVGSTPTDLAKPKLNRI